MYFEPKFVRKSLHSTVATICFLKAVKNDTIYVLFYLSFKVSFNTVQFISQWVFLWAEETSTYSWSRFCKLPTIGTQQPDTSEVGGECTQYL